MVVNPLSVALGTVVVLAVSLSGAHGFAHLFPNDKGCKNDYVANKGSDVCYKVFPDKELNYWEASAFCDEQGGSLLNVKNIDDFLIRMRSAKTYYPNHQLRILGIQKEKDVYHDNKGNVIKPGKLERRSEHSGSLTLWLRETQGIRLFANKHIVEPLGVVCERPRRGKGNNKDNKKGRKDEDEYKHEYEEDDEDKNHDDDKDDDEDEDEDKDNDSRKAHFHKCGSTSRVTKKGRLIVSHKDYNKDKEYPDNYECTWIFRAPKGKVVRLSFKKFEVEGSGQSTKCFFDYVQAYDGKKEKDALYKHAQCGENRPRSVQSNGRFLKLTFKSDDSVAFKGFAAVVRAVEESRDTCRRRCDESFSARDECHCDSKCAVFGDCCKDYEDICEQ